jgi:ParB family chromosome partitioning protein
VTNYLRLLRLPQDIQDLLQGGRLSAGHARTLLGLEGADVQRRIARRVVEGDLSVRATERLVRALGQKPNKSAPSIGESRHVDPNVRAAETKLRRFFGTQVRILLPKGAVSGKIELEFYNQGDLDRLYNLLAQPSR